MLVGIPRIPINRCTYHKEKAGCFYRINSVTINKQHGIFTLKYNRILNLRQCLCILNKHIAFLETSKLTKSFCRRGQPDQGVGPALERAAAAVLCACWGGNAPKLPPLRELPAVFLSGCDAEGVGLARGAAVLHPPWPRGGHPRN